MVLTSKGSGDRISVPLSAGDANRAARTTGPLRRELCSSWRGILTMFMTFFAQAARAPGRQRLFRRAVVAHVLLLTALIALLPLSPRGGTPLTLLGQFLVIAGV